MFLSLLSPTDLLSLFLSLFCLFLSPRGPLEQHDRQQRQHEQLQEPIRSFRRRRLVRSKLCGGLTRGCGDTCNACGQATTSRHYSDYPTDQSWCQNAKHTSFFKMVLSIFDESIWIVDILFCAKMQTLQVDPSQTKTLF